MTKMRRCPICGSPVKPENLTRHLRKVHPGEKVENHLSKEERKQVRARKGVSRREGAVFAAIAIAIVIIVILAIVYNAPRESLVGEEAPDFTVYDVVGERQYRLPSDFYGFLVFVEFFSPTCGLCVDFIPTMQQLYQEYYVVRDEVYFISIDTNPDNDTNELAAFADKHGSDWIHSLDLGNTANDYLIRGTPHLFIIDLKENPSKAMVEYDHPGKAEYHEIAPVLNELLGI